MHKLLLLAGTGWSATTPLWMTLCDHGIINTGITKEPQTLHYISNKDENYWRYKRSVKYERLKHKPYSDLILSKDTTIDDYIEYYKTVDGYAADFSNDNAFLSAEFITEIAPKLKEHFDVKVIMIVRDPVRRSYSYCSAAYGSKSQKISKIDKRWNNEDPKSRFEWRMIKRRFTDSISYWKNEISAPVSNMAKFSYVEIYKKFNCHFPTLPIVMEDLWSGKTEELETFLECKLNGLHRNCYYPEMGTKAPRYEELSDQWMSDLQDLSEDDYNFGRDKLNWIYDEWYQQFKTIPWQ